MQRELLRSAASQNRDPGYLRNACCSEPGSPGSAAHRFARGYALHRVRGTLEPNAPACAREQHVALQLLGHSRCSIALPAAHARPKPNPRAPRGWSRSRMAEGAVDPARLHRPGARGLSGQRDRASLGEADRGECGGVPVSGVRGRGRARRASAGAIVDAAESAPGRRGVLRDAVCASAARRQCLCRGGGARRYGARALRAAAGPHEGGARRRRLGRGL